MARRDRIDTVCSSSPQSVLLDRGLDMPLGARLSTLAYKRDRHGLGALMRADLNAEELVLNRTHRLGVALFPP